MARPKKPEPDTSIPVRLPLSLLAQIKEAARLLPGRSEQDIIRLCTEIGLVRLRRINHKVPEVIDAAAMKEIQDPRITYLNPHDFIVEIAAEEPRKDK